MKDGAERQNLFNDIRLSNDVYYNFDDRQLNRFIFKSISSNRLSTNGFIILGKIYDSYTFPITEELLPKELLKVKQRVPVPYYMTRKKLVLFSSKDAFLLSLYGKDVHAWIEGLG